MSWFRRDDEEDEPAPFRPTPIDVEGLRRQVYQRMDGLLPHGVDEALPHVLDEWVDRTIELAMAQRVRELTEYLDKLMPDLIEARAAAAAEEIVNDADQRDLAEYRLSRDEAVLELLGVAQLPKRIRKRLWRRRARPPALPPGPSDESPKSAEE